MRFAAGLRRREHPWGNALLWNSGSTYLPAGLHEDFLTIFDDNVVADPGDFRALGEPLDVGDITQDSFVVGAINDHLTPWLGCYQTTQLLGGDSEFVFSSAGYIAGLANAPGNRKSFYLIGNAPGPWRF